MPRRSKIELQGLVDKIITMYVSKGMRQKDIAGELTAKGFQVSRGAVQRAIRSHKNTIKDIREKQEWAKTLIAATDKTPRLDISGAGLQIVATKLLEEVSNIEDFGEMEPGEKAALLAKVSRAIGLAANVELNFERGRKQGLLDAGEQFKKAAKEAGLDGDTVKTIYARAVGIEMKK